MLLFLFRKPSSIFFFFLNVTPPPEFYPLPHPAPLPTYRRGGGIPPADPGAASDRRPALLLRTGRNLPEPRAEPASRREPRVHRGEGPRGGSRPRDRRSEEHTSELQSRQYLVCRLLL